MIDRDLPILSDTAAFWAKQYGVYATPQAVVIDSDGILYYRGNYNKARFCTIPGANYASLSVAMLLEGKPIPTWSPLATTAYGCSLGNELAAEPPLFFWSNF